MEACRKVVTFPPHKPFIDCLVSYLLEQFGDGSGALARAVVLLPSRRSALALREAFLRSSGGRPTLLPRMYPFGDVEEELLFAEAWGSDRELAEELASIPPAMGKVQRMLLLAEVIERSGILAQQGWCRRDGRSDGEYCSEQALQLAGELMELLDDMQREDVGFDAFRTLVQDSELAKHWQDSLQFFDAIEKHWGECKQALGVLEPVERRNRVLKALARVWKKRAPDFPVIAAGSTGSQSATADLLVTIAGMEQGHVILPALDIAMDDAAWEMACREEVHPQSGLCRLLEKMELARTEVLLWDAEKPVASCSEERVACLREALVPASLTPRWASAKLDMNSAMEGVTLVAARTPREEARAVACRVRHEMEQPGKVVGIVTPDRALARMIRAELRRFDLEVDDTAGQPLLETVPGVFLTLVAAVCTRGDSHTALLSLLKHPLASLGMEPAECRRVARRLEIFLRKQGRFTTGIAEMKVRLLRVSNHEAEYHGVEALLSSLEERLQPLSEAMRYRHENLLSMLKAHLRAAEAVAESASASGAANLYRGEAGANIAESWQKLYALVASSQRVDTGEYPLFLKHLLAGEVFRPSYSRHPRVRLLSPIEARMQHFDLVVLAGLNEDSWPAAAKASAWMSRTMLREAGLTPPERMVGVSAHDFWQLFCCREVMLTRSAKSNAGENVASRWLQRIEALGSAIQKRKYHLPEDEALGWSEAISTRVESLEKLSEPKPKPPVNRRPERLSVTEIETWQQNPYAVYARHTLRLQPLKELEEELSAADFGTVVHKVMEEFCRKFPEELPEDIEKELRAIAEEKLREFDGNEAGIAYWMPRLAASFASVASWERDLRASGGGKTRAEEKAEIRIETASGGLTLHTRVDRIEQHDSDTFSLVDYKTGSVPSPSSVARGEALQLPLEALIIAGKQPENNKIQALEYWKLAGAKSERRDISTKNMSFDALVSQSREIVEELTECYSGGDMPYLVWPRKVANEERKKEYDAYEHLAREEEWS